MSANGPGEQLVVGLVQMAMAETSDINDAMAERGVREAAEQVRTATVK